MKAPEEEPKPEFDIIWDEEEEEEKPDTQAVAASKAPENRKSTSLKSVLKRLAEPEEQNNTDDFDFEEDDF